MPSSLLMPQSKRKPSNPPYLVRQNKHLVDDQGVVAQRLLFTNSFGLSNTREVTDHELLKSDKSIRMTACSTKRRVSLRLAFRHPTPAFHGCRTPHESPGGRPNKDALPQRTRYLRGPAGHSSCQHKTDSTRTKREPKSRPQVHHVR